LVQNFLINNPEIHIYVDVLFFECTSEDSTVPLIYFIKKGNIKIGQFCNVWPFFVEKLFSLGLETKIKNFHTIVVYDNDHPNLLCNLISFPNYNNILVRYETNCIAFIDNLKIMLNKFVSLSQTD
jgi:hypothetical protein